MVQVFGRAILLVAAVSSLVAIVQFFVNPYFLRIGGELPAFGGKLRSNGVFYAEYLHSYVCVMALIITLLAVQPGKIKSGLIAFYLIGILLSFHRMSWIVTGLVFILYFVLYQRQSFKKVVVWVPLIISILLFFSLEIFPVVDTIQGSSLYKSRLSQNSLDSREKISEMALKYIDEIFLMGAGSTKSGVYYYAMMNAVEDRDWALGLRGGFHNIYVYNLFFYGMPLALLFVIMLLSMFRYFIRMIFEEKYFSFFPLFFLLMFVIMNLTNCFPLEYDFGFYFAMFLGCSAAVVGGHLPEGNSLVIKSA
jgi:hypothetical protein